MRIRTFVLVLFLGGCASEVPSAIVAKVEAAGAGKLQGASSQAIEAWFRQHKDFAFEIKQICQPVREKANAAWSDSTEGRVCAGASVASAFRFQERKGDGRGFEAGK
ncbi:hypothetical protein [Bryobacter aggregatus]|uniref:hypothetical protein n=1 Tax=Bryobacter aggregatus TaxID=360054 RepID=UPI0012BAA5DD|nr:hypothetical protein [Bryobacter aggregatus]